MTASSSAAASAAVIRLSFLSLGALLLLTAGCNLLTFGCNRGSARETEMVATVSDTSGSDSVDVWLSLGENRGGQNSTRQVGVNVQTVTGPVPSSPPTALLGHVSGARFELADGTPIYETPLMDPQPGPGASIAFSGTDLMMPEDFGTLRDHLVQDSMYVVLETDAGAPVMRRTLLHAFKVTGWLTIPCS